MVTVGGGRGHTRSGARGPGYVLLVALFVLLVLMTASLLVAASLNRQHWTYRQELRTVRLTAMLDAAMAGALSALWSDPDYSGMAQPEPFAGGTYRIRTRKIDGLNVEVTVQASFWGGGRGARARVRVDRRPPDVRSPPRVLSWESIPFQEATAPEL